MTANSVSISEFLPTCEAIFFDFDDVLVQSLDIKARAFLKLFPDASAEQLQQIQQLFYTQTGRSRHHKLRHVFKEIIPKPVNETDIIRMGEQFGMLCLRDVIACDEVLGASAFLASIPKTIKRFVVSGTTQIDLDIIIKQRQLAPLFDAVCGTPIPKEDHIAALVSDYQLKPERCVLFGDGIVDYQAATLNKLAFIGVVKDANHNPFPAETRFIKNFLGLEAVFHAKL